MNKRISVRLSKALLSCFLTFAVICMMLSFVTSGQKRHRCHYKLCPYKGVKKKDWKQAVVNYTQEFDGSIPVAIDMLHLHNPKWSYEKIMDAINND